MTTALIVDDSRLARHALSKLLAQHGVDSDEAPSAEAALEYLKYKRPDVVFLDHTMPGMDGLEALDAIKKMPETTTIPVMMYTSQEGQLYVSQARALGAIGVLPKSMRSVDVRRVLQSVHLIDDSDEARADAELTPAMSKRQLTELIRDLLYEQSTIVREELHRELEETGNLPRLMEGPTQAGPRAIWFRVAAAANLLALTVIIALSYGHYQSSRSAATNSGAVWAMAERAISASTKLGTAVAASASAAPERLDTVSWIRHLSIPYSFGAMPLDDIRALEFASLFGELEQSGYVGAAVVGVHAGRFCMNYDTQGNLEIAPPQQPALTCEEIGVPTSIEASAQQSIGFANMVASAARSGQLHIDTVSYGVSQPLIEYPLLSYAVTAGDWNAIAARNQRITIQLPGEAPTREARR